MRLTRDSLIKAARDYAAQRARVSRRIICIYLTGSVLGDAPLLGGTTDIDLFVIHDSEPVQPREVVRLSDEVTLDISHQDQAVYRQPRLLRADPWLGPFLYSKPLVLYDTNHWFDFAQAATGAQFFLPDYVIQRAGTLARQSRRDREQLGAGGNKTRAAGGVSHARRLYRYLRVIENAGNALVSLTGEGQPLTERRYFVHLPQRLLGMHLPELVSGMEALFMPEESVSNETWEAWLANWRSSYAVAASMENAPVRLAACRQQYYERGAAALWEDNPSAAFWPVLRTWALAASHLPPDAEEVQLWATAMQEMKLGEADFSERLKALDSYLDRVDETLETWANANGVTVPLDFQP